MLVSKEETKAHHGVPLRNGRQRLALVVLLRQSKFASAAAQTSSSTLRDTFPCPLTMRNMEQAGLSCATIVVPKANVRTLPARASSVWRGAGTTLMTALRDIAESTSSSTVMGSSSAILLREIST